MRFANKTNVTHYIGRVLEKYEEGDYEVKFLRKSERGKFVFPVVDDVAAVQVKDIIQVLTKYETHREIYTFFDLDVTLSIS